MNARKLFTLLCCLAFVSFSLSCTNIYETSEKKQSISTSGIIVKGTIQNNISISETRTALPSNPTENTEYQIIAVQKDTVIYNKSPVASISGTLQYEIALPKGGVWNITAVKKWNGQPILSDTYTTNSLPNSDTTISINFKLKPTISNPSSMENARKGKIMLVINIPEQVHGFCATGNQIWNTYAKSSIEPGKITLYATEIPSGIYSVEFNFYNDSENLNGTNLIYNCSQKIYVYDNLETNIWTSNGNEEYLEKSSSATKFNITDALIENFIQNVMYVDGNKGDEKNQKGTFNEPFITVAAAVKKMNTKTDGGTIFINSSTKESETIEIKNNITIKSSKSDCQILRKDANHNNSMITIDESKKLILENICINGNTGNGEKVTVSRNGGAGIFNKGTLEIQNVTITNCQTSNVNGGGGIFNDTTGNITIFGENTYIQNNSSENNGGGIMNKGTLVLNAGNICSNTAKQNGGGICASTGNSTSKTEISGGKIYSNTAASGGGIIIDSSSVNTIINAGEIHDNTASSNGGGIAISSGCTLNFYGGQIFSNNISADKNGSGIFCNGTLNMKGSAFVKPSGEGNNNIYLKSNKTITLQGDMTQDPNQNKYSAKNVCAKILTEVLSEGTNALTSGNQYNSTNFMKFDMNSEDYSLKNDGTIIKPIYVSGLESSLNSGSDINGNGTKSKPYATLTKALTENTSYIYISGSVSEHNIIIVNPKKEVLISSFDSDKKAKISRSVLYTNGPLAKITGTNKAIFENISFNGENQLVTDTSMAAGVQIEGNVDFTNCIFGYHKYNELNILGAAIQITSATVSISNCSFEGQSTYMKITGGSLSITKTRIGSYGGSAGHGLEITNGNVTIGSGASVYGVNNYGSLTLNACSDGEIWQNSNTAVKTTDKTTYAKIHLSTGKYVEPNSKDNFTNVKIIPESYPIKGSSAKIKIATGSNLVQNSFSEIRDPSNSNIFYTTDNTGYLTCSRVGNATVAQNYASGYPHYILEEIDYVNGGRLIVSPDERYSKSAKRSYNEASKNRNGFDNWDMPTSSNYRNYIDKIDHLPLYLKDFNQYVNTSKEVKSVTSTSMQGYVYLVYEIK